jgi:hypothetical protein
MKIQGLANLPHLLITPEKSVFIQYMMPFLAKKNPLLVFVVLSVAAHLAGGYFMGYLRPFDLRRPVILPQVVSVSLESPPKLTTNPVSLIEKRPSTHQNQKTLHVIENKKQVPEKLQMIQEKIEHNKTAKVTSSEPDLQINDKPPEIKDSFLEKVPSAPAISGDEPVFSSVPVPQVKEIEKGPVRKGNEFVPVAMEKLTYRVMLYGVPTGTAVLEAANKNGEVRITARVTSNEVFSSVYPVDIFVDTRLMVGNYLLTHIRQHEGSTTGDTGFTLMLREKNAFWVDRLNKRYSNIPLPSEDVMDMISGFYYLRNRNLEVGKPVLLHLFDSSRYVPTTVEVLRKEHLRLPAFREADTLVVHPILETDGFFHTSGDIFIWLTDDEKKVPVKMEAQIPLGKVTAELVAAESEKSAQADSHGVAVK